MRSFLSSLILVTSLYSNICLADDPKVIARCSSSGMALMPCEGIHGSRMAPFITKFAIYEGADQFSDPSKYTYHLWGTFKYYPAATYPYDGESCVSESRLRANANGTIDAENISLTLELGYPVVPTGDLKLSTQNGLLTGTLKFNDAPPLPDTIFGSNLSGSTGPVSCDWVKKENLTNKGKRF